MIEIVRSDFRSSLNCGNGIKKSAVRRPFTVKRSADVDIIRWKNRGYVSCKNKCSWSLLFSICCLKPIMMFETEFQNKSTVLFLSTSFGSASSCLIYF